MREILFRGKRLDNGEWVEGFYNHIPCGRFGSDEHMIQTVLENGKIGMLHDVDPSTVGQYTGLKDKNGKRIFEGDIVNLWWEPRTDNQADEFKKYKAVIEFGNPNSIYSWGWQLKMIDNMPFNKDILLWVDMEEVGAYTEIIGNIHDNPETAELLVIYTRKDDPKKMWARPLKIFLSPVDKEKYPHAKQKKRFEKVKGGQG